ncbi:uncharacterized protein B0T23DRAFT_342133 [Neurospora hispaniola]|uniref:Mitochondrial adapter protein MCP1 transmembrane domain-containing protein n=1 Tax=Neurospora hispaniola TaxID=588809 RepID=A0AAJ0MPI6_9PEZI|nr:hypothetical protein B0T23DRAFT_342133 [Neurospora hispaniola]
MDPHGLDPRDHQLSHKASQETFISLVQLDPEPIQDLYQDEGPDFDPTRDASPSEDAAEGGSLANSIHSLKSSGSGGAAGGIGLNTMTPLGLSGSGHGAIYYLTRIQRYSSYTFSLFASLHLATTSVIPLLARSVPASESYLLLAREIYQTPLSEPLLVALPIVAHVGAGLLARLLRRRENLRRYYGAGDEKTHMGLGITKPTARFLRSGWPRLSWIALSGYGFTAVVAAHAFMNRGLPLVVEGDSANIGLAYVAHGFVRHAWTSWAAYAALLGIGCGHMVWGWAKWFGVSQGAGWVLERHTGVPEVDRKARRKRRRRLIWINAVAAAATAVWAAGGLGVVARGGETLGWVGKVYDGLYDKVPLF